MMGWGADYPDPTNFYDFHFTGASDNFGEPFPDVIEAIRAAASGSRSRLSAPSCMPRSLS